MLKNFSEFDLQELLLHSARNGDVSQLQHLFEARASGEIELDISCKGGYFYIHEFLIVNLIFLGKRCS